MGKVQSVQQSEWVLIALRASRGGLTPVQLQKALFLLSKRRASAVGQFYKFEAYNYGPFCRQIYSDAERMASLGHIQVDESMGRSLRRYLLTPLGLKLADAAAANAAAEGVGYLSEVVPWVQSLPFDELVRAIYQAYPEMRKNSVFQDPQ